MTQPQIQSWLPKRKVAARYNASPRTIERWVKAGRFPKPTRLPNGRDYWTDAEIEAHERNLVGGEAAS
jgi:predicted DNA-binding transcriptional regulator AlpA